jgi:hypothetical protein
MSEKSSHWYDANGNACHTQPVKSRPGATRPTTLKDAKALGLLPSVTTILGMFAKPQLDDWKARQITAAAFASAPFAGEEADAYHGRILDAAFKQVDEAAEAGTLIHKGAELALSGLEYDEDAPVFLPALNASFPLKCFVQPIKAFVQAEEITVTGNELRLVNRFCGYAGTTDAAIRCKRGLGILDFKTRKTKPGKPCEAYDEQPTQIAAYHVAHYRSLPEEGAHVCGCNLYVSTTEPGRVDAVWYDGAKLAQEWMVLRNAAEIWRIRKGYDPRF